MKTRYVIAVGAVLLAVVGVTIAQQQTIPKTDLPQPQRSFVPQPSPALPPSTSVQPAAADPLVVVPQHRTSEAKPEDLTIDQLIDAVEKCETQKTELAKKQRAFIKLLLLKAAMQKQRIDQLSGAEPPVLPPQNVPPSIIPTPNVYGPTIPSTPSSPSKP